MIGGREITTKDQLDMVENDAVVRVTCMFMRYSDNADSQPNIRGLSGNCHIEIDGVEIVLAADNHLTYEICSHLEKSGKPLRREDIVSIPVRVEVIPGEDEPDVRHYVVASTNGVLPVD